jgi:hypothetical protein
MTGRNRRATLDKPVQTGETVKRRYSCGFSPLLHRASRAMSNPVKRRYSCGFSPFHRFAPLRNVLECTHRVRHGPEGLPMGDVILRIEAVLVGVMGKRRGLELAELR